MYKEYNFSKRGDYHTQINNKKVPLRSCNTTSAIMALKQAGISYSVPEGIQDEDYLTSILESDEAYALQEKNYSWSVGKWRPQEVHGLLQWGINKLVGSNVDFFSTHVSFQDLIKNLLQGNGVILSGTFDLDNGKELAHMVSLAGFTSSQPGLTKSVTSEEIDVSSIGKLIIDDPYGDFRTNYKSHKGNDIQLDVTEFNSIFKTQGDLRKKWAHLVKKTT